MLSHPNEGAIVVRSLIPIDRGTPRDCPPRANRAPFLIQCIACVPADVREPSVFTSSSHGWISITETAVHILDQSKPALVPSILC